MKRILALALTLLLLLVTFGQGALATTAGSHTHHWVSSGDTRPATCTESGVKYEYCDICQAWRERTIPALGHSFTKPWQTYVEPTCTDPGKEVNYCQRINYGYKCNYEWRRDIPALGHDWSDWYVVKPAKPGEPGIEERKCNRCGITEQRPLYVGENEASITLDVYIPDQEPTYYEGEKIPYVLEITNNSDMPLYIQWVYYYEPDGSNGYVPNTLHVNINAHETLTYSDFTITVTKADLESSFAPDFTARFTVDAYKSESDASSYNDAVENNGWVYVSAHIGEITEEDIGDMELVVEKKIKGVGEEEENPSYTEGDEIIFVIDVYNCQGYPLYSVEVIDSDSAGDISPLLNTEVFGPHEAKQYEYKHTVTYEECEKGEYTNTVVGRWYSKESDIESGEKNEISDSVTVELWYEQGDTEMWIQKTETSTPANGSYYVEDEEITYLIEVWNCQGYPLYDVSVWDEPSNDAPYELGSYPEFGPHQTVSFTATHMVDAYDISDGKHVNTAIVYWNSSVEEASGEPNWIDCSVESPCGGAKGVVITKKVVSTPANGAYYVEGEEIEYIVDVNNYTGATLHDVVLHDTMMPDEALNPPSGIGDLESFLSANYHYKVTNYDVNAGSVINTAYVEWYDLDGQPHSAYSQTLITPTGGETGEVYDVTLYKAVVSMPANMSYYVEGETVIYEVIIRNNGTASIYDVEISDPLKGKNEDATIDIIPELEGGASRSYLFMHKVTKEEVEDGFILNQAEAVYTYGTTEASDFIPIFSNIVTVPTGGIPIPDPFKVYVHKSVDSTPANGSFYVEGEEIKYSVCVENAGEENIYNVSAYDELYDDTYALSVGYWPMIASGETSAKAGFTYTVTKEDVENGGILNQAVAEYDSDEFEESGLAWSNTVYVPTGKEEPADEKYTMSLTKTVANSPANSIAFVEAETISYLITFVNSSDEDLQINAAYDTVYNTYTSLTTYLGSWTVHAHDSQPIPFSYTVTGQDAEAGYVTNTVEMYVTPVQLSEDEELHFYLTDTVTVDTMHGQITRTRDYPVAYKFETSHPKHGTRYEEGETVEYDVVLFNPTDRTFTSVDAYDILLTDTLFWHSNYSVLGSSPIVIHVKYDVTETDVLYKSIYNIAWFTMYDDEYEEGITVYSNEVIVNTGKSDPPTTPGAPSHCEYKLVAEGVGAEIYSNEYCHEHAGVEAAAKKLIAAAKTEAELDRAWAMAADMWRRSLETEYERLTASAGDEMKEALEKDRSLFGAYLDALKARLAGQGVSTRDIDKELAEILRDRTCELCYTQGTAPEAREDMGECENEVQRTSAPACGVVYDAEEAAFYNKSLNVCDRHLPIVVASQRILAMDAGELGWAKVNAYWQSVVQSEYEAMLKEADPLTRHYLLTERAAFLASASARNALYLAYYPGEVILADELAARMIRQKALEMCK